MTMMMSSLQATEQLVSDILRQALAVGYQTVSHNRYCMRLGCSLQAPLRQRVPRRCFIFGTGN